MTTSNVLFYQGPKAVTPLSIIPESEEGGFLCLLKETVPATQFLWDREITSPLSLIIKNFIMTDQHSSSPLLVRDLMTVEVAPCPEETPVTIMQDQGTRTLFLMHHAGGIEYPAAVLSSYHLLRYLAVDSDEELRNLGVKAARQAPLEAFINRRDVARRRQTKREYPWLLFLY